jgi:hypothetical protein
MHRHSCRARAPEHFFRRADRWHVAALGSGNGAKTTGRNRTKPRRARPASAQRSTERIGGPTKSRKTARQTCHAGGRGLESRRSRPAKRLHIATFSSPTSRSSDKETGPLETIMEISARGLSPSFASVSAIRALMLVDVEGDLGGLRAHSGHKRIRVLAVGLRRRRARRARS